ncbi:hypothetical protein SLEP1_g29217 [Rubroshorea leprosula]|uniref:RING-type E3 ubiquitin transferase n=1 Tax=Rubroshorea leprosula TaxID=152421 RepID=A0AAV5JYQ6_9ROSI|nr:hypothetical protein SLEP1_g29217 [Rubroshorea leprosula]
MDPQPNSPLSSIPSPYYSLDFGKQSTPSSSSSKISPVLLLVIVILALIFFLAGLLHLLVRFFLKRPSFSPIFHSNRHPETSGSHRLQHLFRLHDSGLDQASIDALPVFFYKDVTGLKEPFDCAVCLCEFSYQDKLRLLPACSHAFHIDCIDTWLLSNSTCPLCRGSLSSSGLPMENPVFSYDYLRETSNGIGGNGENGVSCSDQKPMIIEEVGEKRVFSVRLGKFRSMNSGESGREKGNGEISSSCNFDVRRCYSMGAFQYVVDDSTLQVALSSGIPNGGRNGKLAKGKGIDGNSSTDEAEEKRIRRTRGESFSVSKIWLWPNKSRFPTSSDIYASTVSQFAIQCQSSSCLKQ